MSTLQGRNYSTIRRIPITTSVDPEQVGGGAITNGVIAKNAIFDKYDDGRVYLTQRPSLSITSMAASFSLPKKGRGICYWNAVSTYIIVLNDTVYYGDYSLPLAAKMTAGRDPVILLEIGAYLVILDAENNQGWYINSATPTTLSSISDADFPCNIANTHLAGGGVTLDGYLFVMDTNKIIYNSEQYDPTNWNALNFIKAERESDLGIYLTKHHDHIVAMGARSLEFFFDAGNPVGSPLSRRDDVSYRVGPIDRKSVYSSDDKIYFLGSEKIGGVGLFELNQFVPRKVSGPSIDTYFSITRSRSQFDFIVSGYSTGPHNLIFMTSVSPGASTWDPKYTLVYDATNESFTQFDSTVAGIGQFSVVSSTPRSTAIQREPVMIFLSGDIGVFDLTFIKQDSTGSGAYFTTTDYIVNQDDYILNIGGNSIVGFEMIARFGEIDFDSVTNKFINRLSLVGTTTSSAADASPIYVSWTDDHYRTFSAERVISTGINKSIPRLGKCKRRAFQLRYTGTDVLRIEAIELDLRASRYA